MKSQTSPNFWKLFRRLPGDVQVLARTTFRAWMDNPSHPGLNFKKLTPYAIYSIRIGSKYRAICFELIEEVYVWDWIGTHGDYDKEIARLKKSA